MDVYIQHNYRYRLCTYSAQVQYSTVWPNIQHPRLPDHKLVHLEIGQHRLQVNKRSGSCASLGDSLPSQMRSISNTTFRRETLELDTT